MKPNGIVVGGVGLKGAVFLEQFLSKGIQIDSIFTYRQSDDRSRSFERIYDLAQRLSINLVETRNPSFGPNDLCFLVGWQYLIPNVSPSMVVFHDSLLPRYRGFAPTVTALIKGETEIGVTALFPVAAVDQGPIIAQRALQITYPIKIERVLELQASLMTAIAVDIVERWRNGILSSTPQREEDATYSIWRDDADYEIDWSGDADAIERFVNAVGPPYACARTNIGTKTVRVLDVTAFPDMRFEIRDPGKIWMLDNGCPIIVCGSGMLRIDRCRGENEEDFFFRRLRERFG